MFIDYNHHKVHLSNQLGLPFSSGGKVLNRYFLISSSVSNSKDIGTLTIPQWIKMLSLDPNTILIGYTKASTNPIKISVVIPKYMFILCIP
jgi:hypothetical protein